MPDWVAWLLHRIPAHFSHSALRRQDFLTLQRTIEAGEEEPVILTRLKPTAKRAGWQGIKIPIQHEYK